MKMLKFTLSFVLMQILVAPMSITGQDALMTDFLEKWNNAKAYTIDVANAMPDDAYDFKPNPDQRAFHEQLTHICANMIWLSTTYFDGAGLVTGEEPPVTKDAIIELLNASFDYVDTTIRSADAATLDDEVEFFAGPMSRRRVLFLITDHLTHHRGQAIVYLRLNGIEPPRYTGW